MSAAHVTDSKLTASGAMGVCRRERERERERERQF